MSNPNSIPWVHYQDIQIPDVELKNQFTTYVIGGNFTRALDLLKKNDLQLQGKAYIAKIINVISNAIYEVENLYYSNVPVFLTEQAKFWYKLIDDMKRAGTYSSQQQYEQNNFVVYNDLIYFAIKKPPIGTVPTNSEYWILIGLRGIQGAHGVPLTVKYEWNIGNIYEAGDLVVYKKNIYVALKNITGTTPDDATSWLLFLKIPRGFIVVGPNYTENPRHNSVWFKTDIDPLTQNNINPIYGTFLRYNSLISDWEEMYPNTVFTMISDRDDFAYRQVVDEFIILQTDWANNQFTYSNNAISHSGQVNVLAQPNITTEQQYYYNLLSLKIEGNNAVFSISELPKTEINIPLRIIIQ